MVDLGSLSCPFSGRSKKYLWRSVSSKTSSRLHLLAFYEPRSDPWHSRSQLRRTVHARAYAALQELAHYYHAGSWFYQRFWDADISIPRNSWQRGSSKVLLHGILDHLPGLYHSWQIHPWFEGVPRCTLRCSTNPVPLSLLCDTSILRLISSSDFDSLDMGNMNVLEEYFVVQFRG